MRYRIFWKGECIGSFSALEMRDMLARGALGLLHSVELKDGRQVSVSDFFSMPESERELELDCSQEVGEFDLNSFGFLLAGMSFLSVYVFVSAALYCAFLLKSGRGKLALSVFLVSLILAIAGYLFFAELLPNI